MKKSTTPLISIVMPIFIHKEWQLKAAIKSILNQTYKNIELIIVDGSSSSKNYDIVKSFSDNRIFYYKTKGYIKCLNLGIEMAQGEYIARMDSDDISYKTRIEEQYNFLAENQDVDMCSVQAKFFGNVPPPFYDINKKISDYPKNLEFVSFIKNHQIVHPAIMFRKKLNIKYSQFMPMEDCYLFRDLLYKRVKISNIDKPLYSYRTNANSLMLRFPKYCEFRLLNFNIYFLGKYTNEQLNFQEEIFTKKNFCYEDLIDFLKYSRNISKKLKNELDIYEMFLPYFKYMLLHIQDFSYKYFLVLFNQLIYKYWLKIIKQIVKSVLKFCFQIGNKYENNKKIKVITIMGKQFLLQK